jgi:soluble lytic murein transglycosylase-like protein
MNANHHYQQTCSKALSIDIEIGKRALACGSLAAVAVFGASIAGRHFKAETPLQHPAHFTAAPPETPALEGMGSHEQRSGSHAARAVCQGDSMLVAWRKPGAYPGLRKALGTHVESTYRIPGELAQEIVKTALVVSREHNMDPFLALGIIAKESSFNSKARSGYGAAGLMQVYAPDHKEVLQDLGVDTRNARATHKALTSRLKVNVTAGVRIYKQYERQYGSSVRALQAYNGATSDASFKYARTVLALRDSFYSKAVEQTACS